MPADRPDPDRLLAAVARDAARPAGKLKIFLGAAAGVGKTVAMLDAAREARAAGRDVVVGIVETHGRHETQARLAGLEVLPRRASERVDVPPELDLDGIIARRPEIVLVDELAHTNAPGSRHAKRWQDVDELLEAGIDVWTALNIQHLESLNDVVARLTGVEVHETVPDHVFDRAHAVEVIDLTPQDLLARLETGKVYAPDQARRAMAGFFRVGNLIALRQLALRRAAMRVGEQLDEHRDREALPEVWAAAEHLLVAVGPSPHSARLVRVASRIARSLDVPWHAVTIHPVHAGTAGDSQRALEHLRLAEQLGAETTSLTADNVATALVGLARRVNATMIVLGAPTRRSWRDALRGSLIDEVLREAADIDVHVVPSQAGAAQAAPRQPMAAQDESRGLAVPRARDLAAALVTASIATGVAGAAGDLISESDVIMLYVAAVTVTAFRARLAAGLLSAVLCSLAFNFFFTQPRFTLYVDDSRYWLTFVLLGGVGALVSVLASRLREHAAAVVRREAQTEDLFRLTRQLSRCATPDEVARVGADYLHRLAGGPTAVWLPGEPDLRLVASVGTMPEDEVERVVARWTSLHGVSAGAGTQTLVGAKGQYHPLAPPGTTGGVVGFVPPPAASPSALERRHALETVVTLLREFLDRMRLEADAETSRVTAETERVRSTLLSSVSHDLRTPLATITGAATTLLDEQASLVPGTRRELLVRISSEAHRLERLLDNVLNMTRLDSGRVDPSLEWELPDEIVGAAIARVSAMGGGRLIRTAAHGRPVLARLDPVLVEQLVVNFLENAVVHAPSAEPIEVAVYEDGQDVVIEVADRGPGVPENDATALFEKFVRGKASGGTGLGLAICRAIATVHGGRVWARPRPGGGAVFGVALPKGGPDGQRALEFAEVLEQTETR